MVLVVDFVFFGFIYFFISDVIVFGYEYWIIVKVFSVMDWLDQGVGYDVFENFVVFVGSGNYKCVVKLCGVEGIWIFCGDFIIGVGYCYYEILIVFGFGLICCIDVGCVVECIDGDVVVIGEGREVCGLCSGMGFDLCVVDESVFGFFGFG